jgi:hypothetical protein
MNDSFLPFLVTAFVAATRELLPIESHKGLVSLLAAFWGGVLGAGNALLLHADVRTNIILGIGYGIAAFAGVNIADRHADRSGAAAAKVILKSVPPPPPLPPEPPE